MANSRSIQAHINEAGCFVQTSHKLNQDGYFRKNFKDAKHFMFHVLIWKHFNGPIPDGKELHHTCGNRGCFNPNHMEIVNISEHKSSHNSTRYSKRILEAKKYWSQTYCTGPVLANKFDVSFSTGCRWIRNWKETH
jgi:hypothetical protein